MLRVSRDKLMLVAGIVWTLAGANVTAIGAGTFARQPPSSESLLALGAVVVFGLFWRLVFSRMLHRHLRRIGSYEQPRQPVWRFFDPAGYVVMACMMTFGIGLRTLDLVPAWFVSFFYTGLGLALAFAGVGFLCHYFNGLCARAA